MSCLLKLKNAGNGVTDFGGNKACRLPTQELIFDREQKLADRAIAFWFCTFVTQEKISNFSRAGNQNDTKIIFRPNRPKS
jgi:hypothetical protein